MRFVIAQRALALPGGSETFVLTIAENLSVLGHEAIVWCREQGLAAEIGRARAIPVVAETELPLSADATIALDRTMAIDLALRYPRAARLYAMHNANEVWLPPPEPGIVAATLAANDRMAVLARGCAGAGEVVRIRQPIDLNRFNPHGRWPSERPSRVLLVGNYYDAPAQRIDQLRTAWTSAGLDWRGVGRPNPIAAVGEEMARADIVVGYGRSILEAMACGRAAYVHEHSGSDGWVTAESYERLESDGFSGAALRMTPSMQTLREDLLLYRSYLGRLGHDLARRHDARLVAAQIVDLAIRLGAPTHAHDPMAVRALRNLAESRFRADLDITGMRLALRTAARPRPEPKLTLRAKLKRELVRLLFMARLRRPRRAAWSNGRWPAREAAGCAATLRAAAANAPPRRPARPRRSRRAGRSGHSGGGPEGLC